MVIWNVLQAFCSCNEMLLTGEPSLHANPSLVPCSLRPIQAELRNLKANRFHNISDDYLNLHCGYLYICVQKKPSILNIVQVPRTVYAQQVSSNGLTKVLCFLPSFLWSTFFSVNLFMWKKTKRGLICFLLFETTLISWITWPCSPTFKQVFLSTTGVQPGAQFKAGVVGGTVVICTLSATFLQMYFSLFVQLITSHSPANIPVVIATHPCSLSFVKNARKII